MDGCDAAIRAAHTMNLFGRRPDKKSSLEELEPGALTAAIKAYHRATCHDFHRYAAGPGYLDWDNQPDPFRSFEGAPLEALPHAAPDAGASWTEARLEGECAPAALGRASIAALLEYALGLSAWKEFQGSRWALRIDPSSGNLHPTEGYLLLPPGAGFGDEAQLAHYRPREHALERRASIPAELWDRLSGTLPTGSFFVVLSSIPWRESWKYGERAYRYCQHDMGHAIACVALSAGALGWETRRVPEWGSDALDALLGVKQMDAEEPEIGECLLAVTPGPSTGSPGWASASELTAALEHAGQPNLLSPEHVEWRAVEYAARLCRRPEGIEEESHALPPRMPLEEPPTPTPRFRTLARQRRSAVSMDGRTGMSRTAFYELLGGTRAQSGLRPFTSLPCAPRVSLALFVHRVEEIDPGLYMLCRGADHRQRLTTATNPDFLWERAPESPAELDLWCLARADVRRTAAALSCQQEIAADGAFSLGMLADFARPLEERGAWVYPELYWECGAIGQVLYLGAESSGLRATGIGCFFDGPVHAQLGLSGDAFQSLYHFTVGAPVDDGRLMSLPPYPAPE